MLTSDYLARALPIIACSCLGKRDDGKSFQEHFKDGLIRLKGMLSLMGWRKGEEMISRKKFSS